MSEGAFSRAYICPEDELWRGEEDDELDEDCAVAGTGANPDSKQISAVKTKTEVSNRRSVIWKPCLQV